MPTDTQLTDSLFGNTCTFDVQTDVVYVNCLKHSVIPIINTLFNLSLNKLLNDTI